MYGGSLGWNNVGVLKSPKGIQPYLESRSFVRKCGKITISGSIQYHMRYIFFLPQPLPQGTP